MLLVLSCLYALKENKGSQGAVEEYKTKLRSAGEKLSIAELTPPAVPPESNSVELFRQLKPFLAAPAVNFLTVNPPSIRQMVAPGKAMISWRQPDIREPGLDLTNTWEQFDTALATEQPALELFRRMTAYPVLDFQIDYTNVFWHVDDHFMRMKESAQFLSVAIICALHRGDTGEAVTNSRALHSLIRQWQTECLLISTMVRNALVEISAADDWGLLQAPDLTDQQLADLQHDWENLEFIRSAENSLLMERAIGTASIDFLRTSNNPAMSLTGGYSSSGSPPAGSANWYDDLVDSSKAAVRNTKRKTSEALWKASWSYTDQLHALQADQVILDAIRRVETNGYFLDALRDEEKKLATLQSNWSSNRWERVFAQIDDEDLRHAVSGWAVSLNKTLDRVLRAEITRQLTITAIALRRYRLRHGDYPADLSALAPEFLSAIPRDPVDGQPLRYRRNPDGTFLLYSIGKDGKDNGGDPTPAVSTRSLDPSMGRDFVWPQPASDAEIQVWEQKNSRNP